METKLWLLKGLHKKEVGAMNITKILSNISHKFFSTNIHLVPIICQALCKTSYPCPAQIAYSQET